MSEKHLRDIFTPKVVGVSPDAPVAEGLRLMRDCAISCIVALKNGRPEGILTERNVLWAAAHEGASFAEKPVREVMVSPVVTVTMDCYVYEIYNLFSRRKLRHLVVVDDDGSACGVITQSNVVDQLGYDYLAEIKKIEEIMHPGLETIHPESLVSTALEIMASRSISCLAATEDGRPRGILTERDVVRLLAQESFPPPRTVQEVMSRPVWTIDHESPAFEASLIMKERRVRRLVVVGLDGRVCGVVTQSDIIRGLESKYVKTLKNVLETREDELAEAGRSLVEKTIYLDNILRSSIDMGIAATDKSYRITYFNPAAEKLLGVKAQDVSGRDVRELHVAQGVPLARLHAAFEAVVREGGHSFELKRAIDGRQRLIKARVTGIWDKGEEPLGFVLMLRDVTERRRAQEDVKRLTRNLEELVVQRTSQLAEKARELEEANVRLQELDEVKSAFLAEVSHELRTPLTSLLGFAKLISRDFVKLFAPLAGDDPKLSRKQQRIRENLGVMVHEGERLTRLINDLLDLSRIESGRMEWRDELVCAADIVERAVEAVAGQFSQNPDVTLNAQSSDALPRLRVDPDRLQQVLINLLNNAAKFTARGEVQVVAGLGRNERVRFTVSDTGPGLGPDDLENVFEKFRQSSSEDTTGGRKLGAGLGLAICREIVEHYGGRIWVESEQGRGSAFSFEIPTDESLRAAVAEEQPVAGRESRLILVADDDPGVCSYLLQLLASQGYSAAAAHDGASAIQAASRLEPDLIVMDLAMPGMTGQSAIDRMRKDPKLANIPVLVVTGLLKNGAAVGDACLHKPVDEAEFLAAVDRLLQKP